MTYGCLDRQLSQSDTSFGSREGEYSSSAWSERLYRMSNGRARMLLAGLFSALHHMAPMQMLQAVQETLANPMPLGHNTSL